MTNNRAFICYDSLEPRCQQRCLTDG